MNECCYECKCALCESANTFCLLYCMQFLVQAMALTNAAAGFIGASVTLVLVIIFMILMVILVRQCLAFVSKRNAIRSQMEHQRQIREQIRQRRGSVSEPIPATFDWHHSIRIAGTPPPSYVEAKKLPTLTSNQAVEGDDRNKPNGGREETDVGSSMESGERGEQSQQQQQQQHADGPHMTAASPSSLLQEGGGTEVVVVEVEGAQGGSDGGNQQAQGETRTFTTEYTQFGSS